MLKMKRFRAKMVAVEVIVALLLTVTACTPSPPESQSAETSQPAVAGQPVAIVQSESAKTSPPVAQSQPAKTSQPIPAIGEAPQIRQAVGAVLSPDTKRDVPRLPRVTMDTNGDVTVVFALRNVNDDSEAIRTAALADTLAILWAVYHSPETDRVTATTVVGTYAVEGKTGSVRELPMLRAVLSAKRAAQLDWKTVSLEQLPKIVDVWWMHSKLDQPKESGISQAELAANWANAQGDTEGREHKPLTPAEVHAQIDLMLLHLNEALFALSGNDVGVARSQYKQFFDAWDGAEEELRVLYPKQYAQVDLEMERAENALLHQSPEDVNTGRFALRALRAGLLEVAHDLESQIK